MNDLRTDEDALNATACDTFRGRPLAPYKRGLQALIHKTVFREDGKEFFDLAVVYVCSLAGGGNEDEKLSGRRTLIKETDDVDGFRAKIIFLMDGLTDAESADVARLAGNLLMAAFPPTEEKQAGSAPGKPRSRRK